MDSKGKVVLDDVEGKTVLGKTVSCIYGLYFNSYYLRRSCFKIGCSPFVEKSTRYFRNLQMLEVCDQHFIDNDELVSFGCSPVVPQASFTAPLDFGSIQKFSC